ncbi:NADH-quinone oxidoreductase subunit L [Acuticoccus yangtzensis]|uniref:NADH-quinone oxidoreductase subunit L n=1 Tax=Acuticoccus yangtzensis TaxID=1443441 RepID=UPI0009497256|nr:NADH-quinone oxidoreductase subunit L [Acuticoccus yangtzensis]ORE95849.1 NADH:ubiquinone oxidoreductase subunit L [Stappia sp. 22II-S9-Z10]
MVQLLVFLPLFGFLFAFLFGRKVGHTAAMVVTTGFLFVSATLAWIIFIAWGFGDAPTERIVLMEWMISGDLEIDWALRVDTLTAVMLVVVCTVSALVHLYSFGYMSHDPGKAKFFAYLSLFTFAMLMLVTADNLLQMFFGWEGVGLASYLLIGFWNDRPSANAAAIKAFVVNRVGDFGFLLGIFTLFAVSGVVQLDAVFAAGPAMSETTFTFLGMTFNAVELACFLLFIGAMGKSAQFGLHTWLPDAMEGPTPVSALIHAATMVTAGVFMVARMSPLYEFAPTALAFVTFIGATTAIFAATVGCAQNDIKRVIAYSTCSQLGYMFAALGVGAYGIAIFHLFTHAFFKALLFLGAGSVIHAMHDEQDMRNMGGLAKKIPYTYAAMMIGTLALTGFPLTAGYFSKDLIVESAFVGQNFWAPYAYIMLVLAALLTSFYSWRLVFMTFHGPTRAAADVYKHAHESGPVMLIPLLVLSLGALLAGYVFVHAFESDPTGHFWNGALFAGADNHVIHDMHEVGTLVALSPTFAMVIGFLIALVTYLLKPELPKRFIEKAPRFHQFFLNKWYVDELYDFLFVRPARFLGRLFWKNDTQVIDGFGPDGIAARVKDLAGFAQRFQSGYLYHYAFVMLTGIAVFITLMIAFDRGIL